VRHLDYVSIDELPAALRNPKAHDLDALAESISRYGYVEPVVVDERTGRLVSGHGRVEQLRRLRDAGQTPPDGIDGDWRVPVVRGWSSRSDAEAEAFVVAANQLTIRGGWDPRLLADTLQAIQSTDLGLVGVGFTDAELADLLATLGPPPSLEELAGRHGEEGAEDFWPVLSIRLPPDLKARWERVTAGHGEDGWQRLTWLLDAVSPAAMSEVL